MSEIKLLQCPFCGGEARTYFLNGAWLAECDNSKCIGAKISCGYRSKEEATEAWNTRKPIDDMVEQLDKASDYYECDEQGREHVQMVDLSEAIDIVRGGRE